MLTAFIQDQFALNRKLERPQLNLQHFERLLSLNQYENLVATLIQNPLGSLSLQFIPITQYCQGLSFCAKTTFLAKTYLDIVLTNSNFIDLEQLPILILCCVWIAVKFNQNASVWDGFTADVLCQHGHHEFNVEQVLQAEQEILEVLNFELVYTTPFDYMKPFFQSFPRLGKTEAAVEEVITLALTLPELSFNSAEDLFYGSFAALCQIKKLQLSELQQKILLSQIVNLESVSRISKSIVAIYDVTEASNGNVENRDLALIESP